MQYAIPNSVIVHCILLIHKCLANFIYSVACSLLDQIEKQNNKPPITSKISLFVIG